MKHLLTIAAMCLVLSAASQSTQAYVAEEIIESWTGTIEKEAVQDGIQTIQGKVPAYYDETLIQMSVNRIVGKYSDVTTAQTWRRKDAGVIETVLRVEGVVMLVSYDQRFKAFFIAWHVD
jgi:hypothetical protein